jgi:(4-(4-[2-(gamma-L-glutamylamino)ethyl]phenoxymethyl)furan-2-yl)methanamine synthase
VNNSEESKLEDPKGTPWIGLDIGGANIKVAHTNGWSNCLDFPMWKQPNLLASALGEALEQAPPFVGVGLTMTGELADCFQTRAEGVATILDQVTTVLPAQLVRVYSVNGTWLSVGSAARSPWMVAASNWVALAKFMAIKFCKGRSLIVDIGSTTTDIIPISDDQIAIDATTDSQRMQCGALVYTGVERSNVAAISRTVPLFGKSCPLMNELFATSRDVHLWLGDIEENPNCHQTADGAPATRSHARFRLARVVGEDGSTLADSDIDAIANQIRHDQTLLIARGMEQVVNTAWAQKGPASKKGRASKVTGNSEEPSTGGFLPDQILVSGHGDFLVEDAMRILDWNVPRTNWSQCYSLALSRIGPAYAVAMLGAIDSEARVKEQ